MRKLFTYFTVAVLVAVACEGMYGPVEAPTAPDQAGSVEIQLDTLGDDTLAFSIAPVGEVSYYSYLVAKGPAQAVDSSAVYQCTPSGVSKGTFKASDVPTKTITLGELAPNTAYTIYAVAGSAQGIPGTVAVKEVKTTDGVTIAITDFSAVNDSTVVMTFSEQVYLGEGAITAAYYATNPAVVEVGQVPAVADSIVVSGNTVTVQFAGLPHGAYFAVRYPEGTFTDSAKNKIKALASDYDAKESTYVGVYARRDTVAFDLDEAFAEEFEMFNDWTTTMFQVGPAVDSTLAVTGKGAATVNYHTPGKVLSIDLSYGNTYAISQGSVLMVCPEAPAYGTTVAFTFEQDAFQDIWGNPTKAAEYYSLYAYDYTLADVVGTYEITYYSYFYGGQYGWETTTMTIEPLEGVEGYNVKLTEFYGIECKNPIVANFEPTTGILSIPSGQYFADGKDYYYGADGNPVVGEDGEYIVLDVALVLSTYGETPLVLQMSESGYFAYEATSTNELLGIYEFYGTELYNYYDMLMAFEAQKVEAAPEAAPASMSVKKVQKRNVL